MNFYAETTLNGLSITGFEFNLGNANSGVAAGGAADPLNVLLPISTYTATGSTIYNTSTNQTLTPGTALGTGNTSYSAAEFIQFGTSAINQYTVHSFTYSITYATLVPEPSTYAFAGIGALVLGTVLVRRNRRQA